MTKPKEKLLIDVVLDIDKDTFDMLDASIKMDKTVTKEALHLWETVHLLPSSFEESLRKFIAGEYDKA